TVGAGIRFDVLWDNLASILGLTLTVMLIKGLILYVLSLVFKLKGRDQWLFALSLAQAGEFGFVMLSTAVQTNVIPGIMGQQLSVIVALSMLLTPILFILIEHLTEQIGEDGEAPDHDEIDEKGSVIIVGIGRFGQIINRLALGTGIHTVVIDRHIEQIDRMRRLGVKGYFGDPTRPEMLQAAGLMDAKMLIIAVDDRDAAITLVAHARKRRPDIHIIARAYDRNHVYALHKAGANDVVREYFDSSIRAGRYMLENMGWPDFDAHRAATEFFAADRHALLELAELWDPDIPTERNKAYMEAAREINKEFFTGFLANLTDIVETEEEEEIRKKTKAKSRASG
ncbi:MAG: potassium transporter, partial [Rhodobacteraceae bacterium]|nr:potassium transporter [Paracoccaceae bacterium]